MSDAQEPFTKPRTDDGSRKIYARIEKVEERVETQLKAIDADVEEIRKEVGNIWKWIAGAVVTLSVFTLGTQAKCSSESRDRIDESRAATEAKIEKVETALQRFQSETGAEVKGLYRFLLEKQRPDIVRQQVEEQKRETAPPPEPVNPLATPRARR
jgi:hypothetical protein